MIRIIEKLQAVIAGGGLSTIVIYFNYDRYIKQDAYNNLMSAGVNFSAISIGFLASVLSILVVITSNSVVQVVMEIDRKEQLILNYLASVIRWSLFLLIFSALGFLISPGKWFIIWSFFAGATVSAFERTVRLMVALVRRSIYSGEH